MARLKQFDSKYAPKNHEKARPKGLSDPHHEAVMELLAERCRRRDEAFHEEAAAYLADWKENQHDGYYGRTPRELVLAAVVAVSIRQGMRAREEELDAEQGEDHECSPITSSHARDDARTGAAAD